MASAVVNINVSLTCNTKTVHYLDNGDILIVFAMVDASGVIKKTHQFTSRVDGSGVYDENGAQIAATTPATLMSNAVSLKNSIDTALGNAAAAGKIGL